MMTLTSYVLNLKKRLRHNVPNKKTNPITIDLLGISSKYQGGASIFAETLLSEFSRFESQEFRVLIPERERSKYIDFEQKCNNTTFHYFSPRNNLPARIIYRLATRILRSPWLLSRIQIYRWKEVIGFVEENSSSCLTLSTYINFPLKKVKHFCTLHDIQEKAFPQFFTSFEKAVRHTNVLNTLKNVDGLQVSSKFVQNEIRHYYRRESERIEFYVIPEGYSSKEISTKAPSHRAKIGPIRIIMPANYWPHKDHKTLFAAVKKLNIKFPLEVYCTGSTLGKNLLISKMLNDDNLQNVHFTGYLERHELIELYKSCHIVLSCSMYESSSLPILEGAALGCVPVASDIEPHREMSTYLAIHLFQTGNSDDLENVISRIIIQIQDGNVELQVMNSELASKLSWEFLIPNYLQFLTTNNSDVS